MVSALREHAYLKQFRAPQNFERQLTYFFIILTRSKWKEL